MPWSRAGIAGCLPHRLSKLRAHMLTLLQENLSAIQGYRLEMLGEPQLAVHGSSARSSAQPAHCRDADTSRSRTFRLPPSSRGFPRTCRRSSRQPPDAVGDGRAADPDDHKQLPNGAVKMSLAQRCTARRPREFSRRSSRATNGWSRCRSPKSSSHVSPGSLKRRDRPAPRRACRRAASISSAIDENPYEIAPRRSEPDECSAWSDRRAGRAGDRTALRDRPSAAGPSCACVAPPADYFAPAPHRVVPQHRSAMRPTPGAAVRRSRNRTCLRCACRRTARGAAGPMTIQGEIAALNGSATTLSLPSDGCVAPDSRRAKWLSPGAKFARGSTPRAATPTSADDSHCALASAEDRRPGVSRRFRRSRHGGERVTVDRRDIPALFSGGCRPPPTVPVPSGCRCQRRCRS